MFRNTRFPFYRQLDASDCGPTCIRMIASYFGKAYSADYLRKISYINRQGVSLKGLAHASEKIGFRALSAKVFFDGKTSLTEAPMPVIAHWNQNHFIVVYKIKFNTVYIADPASGKHVLSRKDFEKSWISDQGKGILLLLEPTPEFYKQTEEKSSWNLVYLFNYLRPYRKLLVQLILGLMLGLIFSLILPFLTQSIVDVGIQNSNISFIYLILVAQLILFLSQTTINFIQRWILLHITIRINVSLISDFLMKLMKLPIGFFDSKNIGDLMQRIGDHRRIEAFLTSSTLNILFSTVSLVVFSIVLAIYNQLIFFIFLIGAIFHILWIVLFLRARKKVDYLAFQQLSDNQDALIEIIQGMPEIKLQNSEYKRRWNWTHIQARLFNTQLKSLAIAQYQDAGALSISQLKNILISFIAAKAVIDGQMTLGMMMAVQYIVGQVNAPLNQLVNFIRTAQDAKISLERLGEIHGQEQEESDQSQLVPYNKSDDIHIDELSFSYSPISDMILDGIHLQIPKNKTTAVVGVSGSGKTTLIKLLLGFYSPSKGSIRIGSQSLGFIQKHSWRSACGAVLQDGYIFSDTIANNIAESDDHVNYENLYQAAKVANIHNFIESMPLGYNTKIGAKGNGVSQGQRQRILIARAVYKNPDYIFFDEATSSLDANNERIIMNNLNEFFKGKTVIVVAHRLSTVKNADQIVVLDQGKITEIGTHRELVDQRSAYYTLVKNQLELGN